MISQLILLTSILSEYSFGNFMLFSSLRSLLQSVHTSQVCRLLIGGNALKRLRTQ